MRHLPLILGLLCANLSAPGCTQPAGDSLGSAESAITPSLVAIERVPLTLNGIERVVEYAANPRFVALKLQVHAGDTIDLYASGRSPGATPSLWLTDANFKNLVSATSPAGGTAHVHCTVTPGLAGTLYLVLRDANLAPGRFVVRGTGIDPDEGGGCSGSCGGGTTDPDEGEPNVPAGPQLPACGVTPQRYGPTPTALQWFSSPRPIAAFGDRSFVFLESDQWVRFVRGVGVTEVRPEPIRSAQAILASRSMSGRTTLTLWFARQPSGEAPVRTLTFDGTTFGTPVESPCTSFTCTVGAAGDGHIWVYRDTSGGALYEQVGDRFESRGNFPGGPPSFWDVDAKGAVRAFQPLLGTDDDIGILWTLPPGASSWSKVGRLPRTIATAAGFAELHSVQGAFAPDGSIHVFVNTTIGGAYTQGYFRSRDGAVWQTESLPVLQNFSGLPGFPRHTAFFAEDYERVRTIAFQGNSDSWEPRWGGRYSLMSRCRLPDGRATFARTARVDALEGMSAAATFGNDGMATIVTKSGLTQILP